MEPWTIEYSTNSTFLQSCEVVIAVFRANRMLVKSLVIPVD